MKCLVRPAHDMVEVAEGLFQCPLCGFGPSQVGNHSFWAVSNIEVHGQTYDGLCVLWEDPFYVMSSITWRVDDSGERIPGSVHEEIVGYLRDPAECAEAPLPVIVTDPAKWNLPPGRPALRPGMFPNPLGPKELALSDGRSGRSPTSSSRRG